jgi:hypothetical protein
LAAIVNAACAGACGAGPARLPAGIIHDADGGIARIGMISGEHIERRIWLRTGAYEIGFAAVTRFRIGDDFGDVYHHGNRLDGMVQRRPVTPPVAGRCMFFRDAAGKVGGVAGRRLHVLEEALHHLRSGISHFADFNHGDRSQTRWPRLSVPMPSR